MAKKNLRIFLKERNLRKQKIQETRITIVPSSSHWETIQKLPKQRKQKKPSNWPRTFIPSLFMRSTWTSKKKRIITMKRKRLLKTSSARWRKVWFKDSHQPQHKITTRLKWISIWDDWGTTRSYRECLSCLACSLWSHSSSSDGLCAKKSKARMSSVRFSSASHVATSTIWFSSLRLHSLSQEWISFLNTHTNSAICKSHSSHACSSSL